MSWGVILNSLLYWPPLWVMRYERISSLVVNNTCEVRGKIIFLLYLQNPSECDEEECENAAVISQVFGGKKLYRDHEQFMGRTTRKSFKLQRSFIYRM